MKIAVSMIAHDHLDVLLDTIDSIKYWVGDKINIVVDAFHWAKFKDFPHENMIECGFIHNYYRSPYMNVALSLKRTYEKFPDVEWIVYLEWDCLITADFWKKDLLEAERNGTWMLANHVRCIPDASLPIGFREIFRCDIKPLYINLGCCVFYKTVFIKKLFEIDFFDKLFEITKDYENGYFPNFTDHAMEEHLFGSACNSMGGGIRELAAWEGNWRGDWRKYLMRAPEEIWDINEIGLATTIIHPVKRYDSPIREHYRKMRARGKT